MSAAGNLHVEAYAEVASTGEGVAAPGPAVTEGVNDDQRSVPAQPSTEEPDGVREASPAPRAPLEEAPGTKVDLGSEPENDPASPVVPGRTK